MTRFFICFTLVIITCIHISKGNAEIDPGTEIVGAFETKEKQEPEFFELLKEVGISATLVDHFRDTFYQRVQITLNPSTRVYTAVLTCPKKSETVSFESGKEFEHVFMNGQKSKVVIKVEGSNKMEITRKFKDFHMTTVVTFSKEGMEGNVVAKEKFRAKVKLARIPMKID